MRDAGKEIRYPDADSFLTELFVTVGPDAPAGPVSWPDIAAFQAASGMELSPFEQRAVMDASQAFVQSAHMYRDKTERAPFGYDEEFDKAMTAALERGLGDMAARESNDGLRKARVRRREPPVRNG